MRRRELVRMLLGLAATSVLLPLGAEDAAAQPESPAEPSTAAQGPVRNNIVGLNVARLHQPLYIWATSDLVNANGGDWGYVTTVWTIDDRDDRNAELNLQLFLDRCFEYHVQPIVRVATKFERRAVPGNPPPGSQGADGSWTRPDWDEPAKWRTFLERGNWPTRHAWIVVGNEPNLGREWGGAVDAAGYARYLAHFLDVFKSAPRFDIVSGALDISNTTQLPVMQDALEFLDEMGAAVPGIFERLRAWASNPYRVISGGAGARYTHRAYEAEFDRIGREMPVLITEAGHLETGDEQEIARFFEEAFLAWMADPKVVAATPLFWHPDRNDFWMFQLDKRGAFIHKSPTYELMRRLPRVAGSPSYEVAMVNRARETPFEVVAVAEPDEEGEVGATSGRPLVASARPGDTWELEGRESRAPAPAAADSTPTRNPTIDQRPQAVERSAGTPAAQASSGPASSGPGAQTRVGAADTRTRATGTSSPLLRVANTGGVGARLRALPSREAESIAVLPDGAVVQAIGRAIGPASESDDEQSWQRVRAPNGQEGWMATELLAPAEAPD